MGLFFTETSWSYDHFVRGQTPFGLKLQLWKTRNERQDLRTREKHEQETGRRQTDRKKPPVELLSTVWI